MNSTDRRRSTCINMYGVDNVSKLKEVQAKRRKSFEKKRIDAVFYQSPRIHTIRSCDCSVYRLTKEFSDEWLDQHHPFKSSRGTVLALGLVKDNVCYQIMTFKKSRDMKYSAELSRMWTLPTYQIDDKFDKLSKAASEFGIHNIVAYVNLSFENFRDYESIGMSEIKRNPPRRWWIKDKSIVSDDSRRQSRLTRENMIQNGWKLIQDLGTAVYEF